MLSNLKKRLAVAKTDEEKAFLNAKIAHKLTLPKYANEVVVKDESPKPKPKAKKEKKDG